MRTLLFTTTESSHSPAILALPSTSNQLFQNIDISPSRGASRAVMQSRGMVQVDQIVGLKKILASLGNKPKKFPNCQFEKWDGTTISIERNNGRMETRNINSLLIIKEFLAIAFPLVKSICINYLYTTDQRLFHLWSLYTLLLFDYPVECYLDVSTYLAILPCNVTHHFEIKIIQ